AVLVPEVDRPGPRPAPHLPSAGLRRGARPGGGLGDPGEQPPVVHRLDVHAAHADPPGHLRGQGGVLHHARPEGLVPEEVLLRRRPGADRPRWRERCGGRAEVRQGHPGPGRAVRHLPRGHPLPRRQALPRQDRRRPARARDRRPGGPRGRRRHRRGGAPGQEVRLRHPADRPLRPPARLLALRGDGERPLHPALDHRRDHVRDHAALRPGVRRHVRQRRQGAVEEARRRGQAARARGGGRGEEGVL
ncbi:MAG: Acyl-CoA:1-acyl-sn-glycerol-3-phosphate acyltransferase, partial [uncultured Nocardioides sp.]